MFKFYWIYSKFSLELVIYSEVSGGIRFREIVFREILCFNNEIFVYIVCLRVFKIFYYG